MGENGCRPFPFCKIRLKSNFHGAPLNLRPFSAKSSGAIFRRPAGKNSVLSSEVKIRPMICIRFRQPSWESVQRTEWIPTGCVKK